VWAYGSEPCTTEFTRDKGMTKVIGLCLLALATNAVIIQTVSSEDSSLKNIVRVCVLLLAVFVMVLNHNKWSVEILLMANLSMILLLARQNLDQLSFVFIFIFVQVLFSMEERRVEKAFLISSVLSLLLVFALLALGVTENRVLDARSRMTFGTYGVPFFYNLVYGSFTMLIVYSQKYMRKHRVLIVMMSFASTTTLYLLTDARGGYFSFLGFVILLFLVPKLSKFGVFRLITGMLPVIFLAASFYVASLSESFGANTLLSGRPVLYQLFLRNLTVYDVLLSSSVKQFDTNNIVDNSYLHLLVGGGLGLCLVFFWMFAKAVRNLFKEEAFVEISFLIATCAYFNSESIMIRLELMFVIYFWYLVLGYSYPRRLRSMPETIGSDSVKDGPSGPSLARARGQ
jgi:hypothetical protein